ncbi:hypothetical protein [Urbanus proteus nucleopolyhedrovirus]|uniref:Uncharacterized protein n=1 Tax=Urbanus proteus nucleopolyhedrovirus TaxID=1675866 RepID=A0A161C6W1_9ABAC|nr:hypothetical protein [Urbanus proteus nucleopolyhedrovirus]AKR17305.1 hypothetical protein [Urbanus proteus nucleopolyhedrovirus]
MLTYNILLMRYRICDSISRQRYTTTRLTCNLSVTVICYNALTRRVSHDFI